MVELVSNHWLPLWLSAAVNSTLAQLFFSPTKQVSVALSNLVTCITFDTDPCKHVACLFFVKEVLAVVLECLFLYFICYCMCVYCLVLFSVDFMKNNGSWSLWIQSVKRATSVPTSSISVKRRQAKAGDARAVVHRWSKQFVARSPVTDGSKQGISLQILLGSRFGLSQKSSYLCKQFRFWDSIAHIFCCRTCVIRYYF